MISSSTTYSSQFELIEERSLGSSLSIQEEVETEIALATGECGAQQSPISAADDWIVRSLPDVLQGEQRDKVETQGIALVYSLPRLPRLVRVNPVICEAVAELLRNKQIPQATEDVSLAGLKREEVGNFFLALVAICHQTSPRGRAPLEGYVAGILLRGWDFLAAKYHEAVASDKGWLSPDRWRSTSEEDVRTLFHDPSLGDRLKDPDGRAALLRNLGFVFKDRNWRHIEELYALCDGRLAAGFPNLLGELSRFRAYADPVRKKSLFFLSLMQNCGQWRYDDGQLLGPPIDYHEVRGHLRIGTVEILDESLRLRLVRREPVDALADVAIRSAVYDAIMRVVELSGIDASRLHYLFWNVFRSVCLHDKPQCLDILPDSNLPERYYHLARDGGTQCGCPFRSVCSSKVKIDRLVEHVFETDYY